jgi:hypothetical protein
MDCKNIILQGEEAKYAVLIQYQGFDQETDDFKVELSWGLHGQSLTIEKNQMITTIGSGHYFVFDTSEMVGRVTAKCTWYVPDIDCTDGIRTVTDEQLLCFVAAVPLPKFACVPAPSECEHYVTYERTEESDIASGYQYLITSQGDRLITTDSEYILVLAPTPEEP